jgi:hypothetical protein
MTTDYSAIGREVVAPRKATKSQSDPLMEPVEELQSIDDAVYDLNAR